MLTQAVINDLKGIMQRALASGLIKYGEVGAFARAAAALEVEEQLQKESPAADDREE